jgi:hypothetical protein
VLATLRELCSIDCFGGVSYVPPLAISPMHEYKLLSALTLDGPGCLLAGIYWMHKRRCYGGKNRPGHYLTIGSRAYNSESQSFDRPLAIWCEI